MVYVVRFDYLGRIFYLDSSIFWARLNIPGFFSGFLVGGWSHFDGHKVI